MDLQFFLCNFNKFKFSSRICVKLGLHGFGSLYECSLASKVFFPLTLSTVLACSSASPVFELPCTQRQKISFSLQIFTWNLHIVSIKQLYENKGACSFLVIPSSYCLLDRSKPKWTITVFCSDLEVAAALHSILPCTKSIKGESKICNKSK